MIYNFNSNFLSMQRNGTDDISGHFNMRTGVGDITQIGVVEEWNYAPTTKHFPADCNVVRGSAGELYPPGASKDTPITIFNGEMCRPLDLFFTEEINVEGINLYKYSATRRSVDNGTEYPEYKCFSYGDSVPSGVMNVSSCRYNAPVFISFPHYYAADPYYLNFVDGVAPSRKDHEFYIALEPLTGIPVEVAARLQANILIRPSPNIALFEKSPYLFFPLIWFEQVVKIPEEMLAEIRLAVTVPIIGYVCTGFITGIGLILLVWLFLQRKNDQDDGEKMKKSVDFKKPAINNREISPLMKSEKPNCIVQYSDKVLIVNPAKLAPLASDEIDTELQNGAEKESIMVPH